MKNVFILPTSNFTSALLTRIGALRNRIDNASLLLVPLLIGAVAFMLFCCHFTSEPSAYTQPGKLTPIYPDFCSLTGIRPACR